MITLVVLSSLAMLMAAAALYGYLADSSWLVGAHVLAGTTLLALALAGSLVLTKCLKSCQAQRPLRSRDSLEQSDSGARNSPLTGLPLFMFSFNSELYNVFKSRAPISVFNVEETLKWFFDNDKMPYFFGLDRGDFPFGIVACLDSNKRHAVLVIRPESESKYKTHYSVFFENVENGFKIPFKEQRLIEYEGAINFLQALVQQKKSGSYSLCPEGEKWEREPVIEEHKRDETLTGNGPQANGDSTRGFSLFENFFSDEFDYQSDSSNSPRPPTSVFEIDNMLDWFLSDLKKPYYFGFDKNEVPFGLVACVDAKGRHAVLEITPDTEDDLEQYYVFYGANEKDFAPPSNEMWPIDNEGVIQFLQDLVREKKSGGYSLCPEGEEWTEEDTSSCSEFIEAVGSETDESSGEESSDENEGYAALGSFVN